MRDILKYKRQKKVYECLNIPLTRKEAIIKRVFTK